MGVDQAGGLKDLAVVPIEGGTAVVEWGRVRFADMPQFQRGARARVDAALKRQGVVGAGPAVTFSRPPSGETIEVAVGVMVEAAFEPVDAITVQAIPSGRAARARLEAPYETLPQAWRSFMAWVAAERLRPSGLHWEVYTDPSGPVTELYTLLD